DDDAFASPTNKLREISLGAPGSGEVELISPLGELRGPRQMIGAHRVAVNFQPQTCQEGSEGRKFASELPASRAIAISPGSGCVPIDAMCMVKGPDVPQKHWYVAGVTRKQQAEDLRAFCLHLRALDRIIVNEDKVIQRQLKLIGEGFDIVRF